MARRRAFAYSADIRQIPPELGLTNCRYKFGSIVAQCFQINRRNRRVLPIALRLGERRFTSQRGLPHLIQVAAKTAGAAHRADVLIFVKSPQ
jgi:hypothetical protein